MKTGHQISRNLGAKIRALTKIWDHYRSSKNAKDLFTQFFVYIVAMLPSFYKKIQAKKYC